MIRRFSILYNFQKHIHFFKILNMFFYNMQITISMYVCTLEILTSFSSLEALFVDCCRSDFKRLLSSSCSLKKLRLVPEIIILVHKIHNLVPAILNFVPETLNFVTGMLNFVSEMVTIVPDILIMVPEIPTMVPEILIMTPVIPTMGPEILILGPKIYIMVPEILFLLAAEILKLNNKIRIKVPNIICPWNAYLHPEIPYTRIRPHKGLYWPLNRLVS